MDGDENGRQHVPWATSGCFSLLLTPPTFESEAEDERSERVKNLPFQTPIMFLVNYLGPILSFAARETLLRRVSSEASRGNGRQRHTRENSTKQLGRTASRHCQLIFEHTQNSSHACSEAGVDGTGEKQVLLVCAFRLFVCRRNWPAENHWTRSHSSARV